MFMLFMSRLFMLLMFILSCLFALEFAGLVAGFGDAVTVAFELALLFGFCVVVHAGPSTAKVIKARKPVIRRISVPPRSTHAFLMVALTGLLECGSSSLH